MPQLLVFSDSSAIMGLIEPICAGGGWEPHFSGLAIQNELEVAAAHAVLIDMRTHDERLSGLGRMILLKSPFTPVVFLGSPQSTAQQLGRNNEYCVDPQHLDDLQHILLSISLTLTHNVPICHETNPVPRILIVDDNMQLAGLIERALRAMERFDVRVVGSGYEAASVLPSFQPDVAVVDLALGDVDGRDVCRFIRGNAKLQNTRIIAVSGYLCEDRMDDDTQGSCFDAFLEKPFRVKEIINLIIPLLRPAVS